MWGWILSHPLWRTQDAMFFCRSIYLSFYLLISLPTHSFIIHAAQKKKKNRWRVPIFSGSHSFLLTIFSKLYWSSKNFLFDYLVMPLKFSALSSSLISKKQKRQTCRSKYLKRLQLFLNNSIGRKKTSKFLLAIPNSLFQHSYGSKKNRPTGMQINYH